MLVGDRGLYIYYFYRSVPRAALLPRDPIPRKMDRDSAVRATLVQTLVTDTTYEDPISNLTYKAGRMSNVRFNAALKDVSFYDCNLQNVRFSAALQRVRFYDCQLYDVVWGGKIESLECVRCVVCDAVCTGSTVSGWYVAQCRFLRLVLGPGVRLLNARLQHSTLTSVTWGAHACDLEISDCAVVDSCLDYSRWVSSSWVRSRWRQTTAAHVVMAGVVFTDCDLRQADVRHSAWSNGSWVRCNATGLRFAHSVWRYMELSGVGLVQGCGHHSRWDNVLLDRVDLTRSSLADGTLTNCKFVAVREQDTVLQNTVCTNLFRTAVDTQLAGTVRWDGASDVFFQKTDVVVVLLDHRGVVFRRLPLTALPRVTHHRLDGAALPGGYNPRTTECGFSVDAGDARRAVALRLEPAGHAWVWETLVPPPSEVVVGGRLFCPGHSGDTSWRRCPLRARGEPGCVCREEVSRPHSV